MRFADIETQIAETETTFEDGIQLLKDYEYQIPTGWREIYRQGIKSLMAVNCPKRNHIRFEQPDTDLGMLTVACIDDQDPTPDPIVLGILRKLTKKSICTCEECGKRALGQTLPIGEHTLCSRCFVPREMRKEIRHWLNALKMKRPLSRMDPVLPLRKFPPSFRVLIPSSMVRNVYADNYKSQLEYITPADLEQLKVRMEQVQTYLNDMFELQDLE